MGTSLRETGLAWSTRRSCQRSMKEEDRIVDEIRYIAASLVGAGIDQLLNVDYFKRAVQNSGAFYKEKLRTSFSVPLLGI